MSAWVTSKLHIGGKAVAPGWEIFNIQDAPGVNHVGDANDLSRFEPETFDCIYASHIVEHLDYEGELHKTLVEWRRTLTPGGALYISVPDLDVIAGLILEKQRLGIDDRFFAMRMLFGGHIDADDYHQVGLNEDFLRRFLIAAGFADITKVAEFGLFNDTSKMRFMDVLISLNMVAVKPQSSDEANIFDGVRRSDPCPCGSGNRYRHCHGKI